ncbi:MAG: L-arabinose ABC transporter ATP-binding protein AraG [bacterium]|nr:L-arabinose ABC transporter ATP-binding protein AraG [bacterium]
MEKPGLYFDAIGKYFPGVQALQDITFGVREGSVHGLIGENGAGKSTLLKTLSGVHQPDGGTMYLDRQAHSFQSPVEAIQAGVAIIYQELHLVPEMSVAENLMLGHLPNQLGVVNRKQLKQAALEILKTMGEEIDPFARLSSLPLAQRQMIEIAKALMRNAKVIAFDEPTSSLSDKEVHKLFSIIRELKALGHIILYVSHRMHEIFDICDSVTVFRDGKHIETFDDMTDVTLDILVNRMVGRSTEDIYHYTPRKHGDVALEVETLLGPGISSPVDLSVNKGEIVGLFGLVGAGRTELLKLIYGAVTPETGTVKVFGKRLAHSDPSSSIKDGLMFCPEDRKKEGIIPIRSVLENINLSVRRNLSSFGVIHEKKERANAEKFKERLDIKTPSLTQLIKNLSGGNQQKVILARWLSEDMKVILFDEPTRGIDVGSKSEIYAAIAELASQGFGVLVVSSELPEVLGISDRVLVMRQGKLERSLDRNDANEENVLKLALPVVDAH